TVDLRVDEGASAPERSFSTNSNTGAARLTRSLPDRARRRLAVVDGCSATALIFGFRISDFGLQISRNQSTKHKVQSTKYKAQSTKHKVQSTKYKAQRPRFQSAFRNQHSAIGY